MHVSSKHIVGHLKWWDMFSAH